MDSQKPHLKNKSFRRSAVLSLAMLFVAMMVQSLATIYATRVASQSVSDIILSNTRVYDVDAFFVWGTVILTLYALGVSLYYMESFPFVIKSIALFTLIRSVFVSLTHLAFFPGHIAIGSSFAQDAIFRGIFTGNDLFFSGHTGIPFLLALIFWHNKKLRLSFLAWSGFFAAVVLLGHIHYSIDVLSAFFITYAIYDLAKFVFNKDKKYFDDSTELPLSA